jgi:hypothetical protein
MENKSVHNNPRDLEEEIFERLEAQVIDINCNMNLLMVTLEINIRSFREVGGSN